MATQLDLQEQEQLDDLKAFWKQYGNLIGWVLILVFAGFAAWNGWNWYQRNEAAKASAMFGSMQQAQQTNDATLAGKVFADLKDRYPRTAFAEQAGLLAAKLQYDKGQVDAAKASLAWVAGHATEDEYRTIAHLRLSGVLIEQKQYDEALKQLGDASGKEFAALVDDRRGDILLAQGKKDDAKSAYQAAYKAMDAKEEYRRLIDAKLTALGAPPAPAVSASAAGARS